MKNVSTVVDEARSSRKRVLAAVDQLTSEQGAFKPAADKWCINEILQHLVMAEQSGITKMWLAAEGVRSGKTGLDGCTYQSGFVD